MHLQERLETIGKESSHDAARETLLGSPGYIPHPPPPSIVFDTSPPRQSKIVEVLRKAESASAPGPNGLSYKFFKNCPQVTAILWKLMMVA